MRLSSWRTESRCLKQRAKQALHKYSPPEQELLGCERQVAQAVC
jgi:hypothetical protein